MANRAGKAVDNTHLSLQEAHRRAFLHADYLAHYLRWSHVKRFLTEKKRHQTYHVLDVGCGREFPLPRMMYSNMLTHTTGSYTGVDYNKLDWPDLVPRDSARFRVTVHGQVDFAEVVLNREFYDLVTCFEVVEHVEPFHAFRMLQRICELVRDDGSAFISTPCYDPRVGAAGNHVNEMSYDGLWGLLEAAGLYVIERWGTFASQKDYKPHMDKAQREVFDQLRAYYDPSVLSVIMAPMFPEQARNCIWHVRARTGEDGESDPVAAVREVLDAKHSSSALWPKHLKQIIKELS